MAEGHLLNSVPSTPISGGVSGIGRDASRNGSPLKICEHQDASTRTVPAPDGHVVYADNSYAALFGPRQPFYVYG